MNASPCNSKRKSQLLLSLLRVLRHQQRLKLWYLQWFDCSRSGVILKGVLGDFSPGNFFFNDFFIYLSEHGSAWVERGEQEEREKQTLLGRDPDAGLCPRTPRSRPELKAARKLTKSPGAPLLSDFCLKFVHTHTHTHTLLSVWSSWLQHQPPHTPSSRSL